MSGYHGLCACESCMAATEAAYERDRNEARAMDEANEAAAYAEYEAAQMDRAEDAEGDGLEG